MAKRSRGTVRPGQRQPIQRSGSQRSANPRPSLGATTPDANTAAPAVPTRPGFLTPDEEARAAELEARILAEERSAAETQRRSRDRARSADLAGPRTRDATPLSVRAAGEYAYVRRDISRIARVAGFLLATLVVLHLLINVLRVVSV